MGMPWEVEFTDQFGQWWRSLSADQQDDIAYSVALLAELGPSSGIPHSSEVARSRHAGMRELRTQSGGRPLRALYIFHSSRTAVLLIGGDKAEDNGWYDQLVFVADRIYQRYLNERRREYIDCEREYSVEEIGREFNVMRQRIRQIEANALRQLRSPERARYLRALLASRGYL